MSNLTSEQLLAVEKKNTNIIVSAGAGSGKTTVLKSRVLRILKSGVNINNLIILTFTNNAAAEMKERIRKIILDNPDLSEQAELLDSAYITTFDSFAQSLVKKYNYLLGIDKNFSIVDNSVINLKINEFIDEIFEHLYEIRDSDFIKLVNDIEVKDDKKIRDAIKRYYYAITNILDRQKYLDDYVRIHYSKEYIDEFFSKYEEILFDLRDKLLSVIDDLKDETTSEKVLEKINIFYEAFLNASQHDDLLELSGLSLPAAKGDAYTEEGKELKALASNILKKIKAYLTEDKETLIEHYKSTIVYARIIVKILLLLDDKLNQFKRENNVYQFFDIAFLAINLVKEHESVRKEIRDNTYEIMIDEYQDTNDIQEEFISYIQNDNVYTVGDIKQSIYRFRNANPYIFKKRYDDYSKNINGFKIDLNRNFRSRSEVIDSINLIFDNIMYDSVGGAEYKKQHEMIYGNKAYLEHLDNGSYDTEILEYDNDETDINAYEAEAFIIADDILKRVQNKEKVTYFDKEGMQSRIIDYKDFCILVDKSNNFNLLKKVLEYKGIPTTIYKDININDEDEIYILKNLINLIIKVKNNIFDVEFKHSYLSIARSYVLKMSDEEIYEVFSNNEFENTELYRKALIVSKKIDSLSNQEILETIIEDFEIINKLNLVGDINERLTKLEYFMNNANDLNKLGMDIYDLVKYFDELLSGDEKITMSTNKDASSNTVKIMTIHGSKGLEYPYVYLPYLNADITKDPVNSKFKISTDIGFILPFYDEGVGNTFMMDVYKTDEVKQAISEKIRLFYVALTRAKEKIIIINKFNKKINPTPIIQPNDLLDIKTLADILTLIKYKISMYIRKVDLDKIDINKDYNLVKISNYESKIKHSDTIIKIKSVNLNNSLTQSKKFSKSLAKVVDLDLKKKLDFGTFMHYVFEVYDFNNSNLDNLNIEEIYKEKVRNFLKHEEVRNISTAKCFKEQEICFKKDSATFHGFIDLLVEYSDHFDIIDYKLSNIEKKEYVEQLSGYKDYIEEKFNKPCNIYLYSINKDVFKKLN